MIINCNPESVIRRRGSRRLPGLLLSLLIAAAGILFMHGEAQAWIMKSEDPVKNVSGNLNIRPSVDPVGKKEGYSAVLYDNRNGLPTSEANAIAQTEEGFLWIGSYSGLIRYDGSTFERMDSTTGISNVRCLYVDSQNRLWIGTNDAGIFLMSNGNIRNWNKSNGLESVSIRAIIENEDGCVYIGSSAGVARIDAEMDLTMLQDERIADKTIREFKTGMDGEIYGLTQNGDIFTIKGDRLCSFLDHEECRVKGVLAIAPDPAHPGNLYLGTDGSEVYYGNLERNFASMGVKNISPLSYTESFENIDGELWICAGNGIGKLSDQGFHWLKNLPMNNSVGHVMTDYEGNLWFTSTRQGVMKIVPNQFSDLFERYNLESAVVNSTCMYGRQLFIGTDTGLVVTENGEKLESLPLTGASTASGIRLETADLLEYLDGVRIRSLIRDSKGRLWISTWRKHGLLCYDQGKLRVFGPEDGLFSNQVRTVSECEDGTILVANTGGVSIIQDDIVTGSCSEDGGIPVDDVLTVTEGFHNEIVIGTDGSGIYVVDGEETKQIGTEDGLASDVVMRIKRSRFLDIYWIVTSNSLAFMTPDFQVTTIREFPYPNNYDLYENSKEDVWILSSNGIYVISAEELLANGTMEPVFYGFQSGLPYVATANSYSELTAGGDLYISATSGVVKVNIEKPFEDISMLKIAVPYVDADGKRLFPDESGRFNLPGNVRKLTIYPYVFNYSMIDPQISYRLEGFDTTDATVSRSKLTPIDYTNLKIGAFHFVMRVKDPVGHSEQMVSFSIIKGKEMSAGTAGTIIMIAASLLLMGGTLIYTSSYRKRKRLEDRLIFDMMLANILMAAGELLSYVLEYTTVSYAGELMTAGNTIFYVFLVVFPYLLLLYLDYRVCPDKNRLRKRKLLYGIPCLLFLIIMIINLKTGWIFFIGEGNVFLNGPRNEWKSLPTLLVWCYLVLSLVRVHKISKRLTVLGLLLLVSRLILELWVPSISFTPFVYTLILVCIHLYGINLPINEVTQ